ncbi:BQ2448_5014 [Microbotryum intermedium]|uniref:BQ2448_5014 protein n=1 Tax=Microbotryum intermedium TaxID=269621 RepID=A0A238F626_9BASI|nr:BQ2448_5014 [Microbotryum intermedium]
MSRDTFPFPEFFGVKKRIVLITGGGTGIGLMCAKALGLNEAKVYIMGRRNILEAAVEEFRKLGTKAEAIGRAISACDFDEALDLFKIKDRVHGRFESPFSPSFPNWTIISCILRCSPFPIASDAMGKASATHLTKMLATILKDSNVRCNEIALGFLPSGIKAWKRAAKRLKPNAPRTLEFGTAGDTACTILCRCLSGSVVMLDGEMLNKMPNSC